MASRRTNSNYSIPLSQPNQGAYGSQYTAGNANRSPQKPAFHFAVLDKLHNYASTADNKLSELGAPLKPYLPLIGRLLVVSTFIEDTLRIITSWSAQVNYLWRAKGIPWIIVIIFFLLNIILMVAGSVSVVAKRRLVYGVGALGSVIVLQTLAYGAVFDLQMLARDISLVGGLLLVLSDVFVREKRNFPGLPEMDSKDRSQNFILVGRVLIVVLYATHMIRTKWTIGAIFLNLLGITSCTLLVIGYKAKFSASLLAALLLFQNFVTNQYWKLQAWNPQRDSKQFEYFQTLSIVGGLILLVNIGAGKLSFDEKRKIY